MISPNVQPASYFQRKGFVSVADGDAIRTIKDIAETFGLPLAGHGSIVPIDQRLSFGGLRKGIRQVVGLMNSLMLISGF